MAITVHGPDDQEIEFPDGTPPDTIKAVLRKKYGGPEVQKPAAGDTQGIPNDPLAAAKKAIAEGRAAGTPEAVAADMADTGQHTGGGERAAIEAAAKIPQRSPLDDVGDFAKGQAEALGRGWDRLSGKPGSAPVTADDVGDVASNFVRSVTAPMGGDYIAAAGSAVAGKGFNPGEQRVERERLAEQGPVTAAAGNLLGVGGVGKVVGARVGQGAFVNGVTTGAVAGAATNENPLVGGVKGAIEGGLGGKGMEGLTKAAGGALNTFSNLAIPKAVRVLANRLQIPAKELVAIKQQMTQEAGHEISWAQAADSKTVERFRALGQSRKVVGEEAGLANAAARERRPSDLANIAEDGRMLGTPEAATAEHTKNYNDMMDKHGDAPVTIQNPKSLNVKAVRNSVRELSDQTPAGPVKDSLTKLRDAIEYGGSPTVTLRDIENIRGVVAETVKDSPRLAKYLAPVRDALRKQAAKQVGAYGSTMHEFERGGDFITGMEQGAAAASPGASTQKVLEQPDLTHARDQRNGAAVGFRTRLKDDMSNTTGQLPAEYMSPGFQARAEAKLGTPAATRINKGFRAEIKAGQNLDRLDTTPHAEKLDSTGQQLAARSAGMLGGRNLGGMLDIVAAKTWGALRGMGISNVTARKMAQDLHSADPVANARVGDQLKKLGIIKDKTDLVAARAALLGAQAGASAATKNKPVTSSDVSDWPPME